MTSWAMTRCRYSSNPGVTVVAGAWPPLLAGRPPRRLIVAQCMQRHILVRLADVVLCSHDRQAIRYTLAGGTCYVLPLLRSKSARFHHGTPRSFLTPPPISPLGVPQYSYPCRVSHASTCRPNGSTADRGGRGQAQAVRPAGEQAAEAVCRPQLLQYMGSNFYFFVQQTHACM